MSQRRRELQDLTSPEIAPLDALIQGWPDSWSDLAHSLYLTLLDEEAARPREELATLVVALVRGIAHDLGGTQPYINMGVDLAADEKAKRVIQAWRAGQPWSVIAQAEGVSDRRVRQIVSAWQRRDFERQQGTLPL